MARDLYQEITDKVIAQLEAGTAPWIRPWKPGARTYSTHSISRVIDDMPSNWATGRAYRGANVMILWMTGYADQRWLTYNQAQAVGGQVRKGEKGTQVILFKPWSVKDVNAKGETEERSIPVMRSFTVFNVSQIDGLPERAPRPTTMVEAVRVEVSEAEALQMANTEAARVFAQAKCVDGGDRAAYSPATDTIFMPPSGLFPDEASYWEVALHELTHWSGHSSRLDRRFDRFGSEAYAREELVAEIGAAFLCAMVGLPYTTRHGDYVANWLEVLKGDKKAVVQAAAAAQRAADFLNPEPAAEADHEAEEAAA